MRVRTGAGGLGYRGPDDIDEESLRQYLVRLVDFVLARATWLLGWLHLDLHRGTNLTLGKGCEDVAQEALLSLYGPPQQWDPEKHPDPWPHLVWVAKSRLIALARRAGRRVDHFQEALDHDADPGTVPDNIDFTPEDDAAFHQFREAVEAELILVDDPDLWALYKLAEGDGHLTPRFVAEKLGMKVRDVDNLKERLQRLIRRVQHSLWGEQEGGSRE